MYMYQARNMYARERPFARKNDWTLLFLGVADSGLAMQIITFPISGPT